MKEIIKQILLDFHKTDLPDVIQREIKIPHFPSSVKKALVFIGMRRSGKTYLMYQNMKSLLDAGFAKEKLCYINFEDDRLIHFSVENFQDLLDAYFDCYPQYINSKDLFFYFDEIHIIPHWEKFIRRLLDKENMRVFITGSSAKMLSKEIATTLRGRCYSIEVFPLSFSELAYYHKISERQLSAKEMSKTRQLSKQYLEFGGFPEIINTKPYDTKQLLQEYINTAVYRDVIERYGIKNIHIVKLFMTHCLQNISSLLSVTKVFKDFKSNGETLGKDSLYEYLEYFKDAYLLFTVPLFTLSYRRRRINPNKIYCIDPGIISAFSVKPEMKLSACLENAVFINLRYRHKDIFYYKTNSGKEVDFIITYDKNHFDLFQVCLNVVNKITLEREVNALIEAENEISATNKQVSCGLYLITFDTEIKLTRNKKSIVTLPFWRWALQLE